MAIRKRTRQSETGGLVIVKAVYGSRKALKYYRDKLEEEKDDSATEIMDVSIPLNFLVSDSSQLKVFFSPSQ